MAEVTIRDEASGMLQWFAAPKGLNTAIGAAVTQRMKDHLFAFNDAHPNQLGGRRSNFYSEAARMTNWQLEGVDGVIVEVSGPVGFRQRLEGGPIKPGKGVSAITGQPTTYLTFPAIPEAYGTRASEWTGLRMLWRTGFPVAGEAFALAATAGIGYGRRPGTKPNRNKVASIGRSQIVFWLSTGVIQDGNSAIVPDQQTVKDTALGAVAATVERQKQQEGSAHG